MLALAGGRFVVGIEEVGRLILLLARLLGLLLVLGPTKLTDIEDLRRTEVSQGARSEGCEAKWGRP